MAVNLSPIWGAGAQLFDNSGNVLSGGKIYTYAAGTTTPATTYTSSSGITANSNPIILNSAGRVPYEIWLTDGISYKYVLKDSNDTLIATYDNLIGINSNFLNYAIQEEIQTATAGQTVFTLNTVSYQPGTNTLSVFVDGVNQYDGVSYSYVETSSTVVTFNTGLHVGALVKFTTAVTLSAGVTDASLVVYDPPFVDSVQTTVAAKLAQTVSVKDFGAVGDGVTDNLTAITNAIANSNGKTILVPVDSYGGDYAITTGTLTIPSAARFQYEAGARIYAAGGTIIDSGRNFYLFAGGDGEGVSTTATRGLTVELNGGNSGTGSASTLQFNRLRIAGDTLDAAPDANGTKVDGLLVHHSFGGTGTKGGRHAIEALLDQTAITEETNPDRFYCGLAASSITSTGDGGSSGAGRGGYFGGNFVASHTGGRWINNLTACEFNTNTKAAGGNEIHYHSGIQIGSGIGVRGYTIDTAIAISNKSTSANTWRNGIRFGNMNGGHALGTDSKCIVVTAESTILSLIEAPECTSYILKSGDVALTNTSLTLGAPSSGIEIGSVTSSGTGRIDFHTSGNEIDYDSRILASGGNASVGEGVLALIGQNIQLTATSEVVTSGVVRPVADNTYNLGRSDRRWSVVYAATGAINTSDANEKQQIRNLSDAEQAVAIRLKSLIKAFKFNDAVKIKKDKARIHVGVIAQDVKAAFEAEGLMAEDYAILCYDEWTEQPEVLDNEGNVIQEYRASGSRYGVRYEELLAFIIGAL